jgi:SAM-dependent methyltransferase
LGLLASRYLRGDYLRNNPSWDIEDSLWKAERVTDLVKTAGFPARSFCEVGCGAGGVLAELRKRFPDAELVGYDIASDASKFWPLHGWADISFCVGDFLELNRRRFDVLLLLDVIEHLENPFDFLLRLREYGCYFVFHLPLDLSVSNVLREKPLLRAWSRVGHLHFFTKGIALSLLKECQYYVLECCYTGAAFTSPKRDWKTRLADFPRRLAYLVNKDFGVRLLGGETLMILAQPG